MNDPKQESTPAHSSLAARDAGTLPSGLLPASDMRTVASREDAARARTQTHRPQGSTTAVPGRTETPPQIPGFRIHGVLGRGGMGIVYHAHHLALDRSVALKMILDAGGIEEERLSRFRSEAQSLARLQHPGIVQVFEVGQHEGKPFCVLEFVEGGSLAGKLGGLPRPPRQSAGLTASLARSMQAAHDAGVIHRDLKPGNVLVGKDWTLKITDFGLAKKLDDDSGSTRSGAIMGTPSYMAPEQAHGDTTAIGPAADVYALGAILYEMLTGRPPFRGANYLDTLQMVRGQDPVPPRQFNSRTPRDLETICLKCLHKSSARRYGSAAELADDLDRFLAGKPIAARPIGPLERSWKWARRNPALAGSLAAGIGVGLIAFVLVLGAYGRAETDRLAAVKAATEKNEALTEALKAEKAEQAARIEAQTRQKEAEQARKVAQDRLELAESSAYGNRIMLAWRAVQAGSLREAADILDTCPFHLRQWEWRYLRNICREETGKYQPWPWNGRIRGMALMPGGKRVLGAVEKFTGSNRTRLGFWNAATGRLESFLQEEFGLAEFTLSPDGSMVAVAHQEGVGKAKVKEVVVLALPAGKVVFRAEGSGPPAFDAQGKRLAFISSSRRLTILECPSGKQLLSSDPLPGKGTIRTVFFSPNGQRVLVSDDATSVMVDADRGTAGKTFPLAGFVVPSADGTHLAGGGQFGLFSGFVVMQVEESKNKIRQYLENLGPGPATFSPRGRYLAVWNGYREIEVVDFKSSRRFVRKVKNPRKRSLVFLDEDRLLVAEDDRWGAWKIGDPILFAEGNFPADAVPSLGPAGAAFLRPGTGTPWAIQYVGAQGFDLLMTDPLPLQDLALKPDLWTWDEKRVVALVTEGGRSRLSAWDRETGRKLWRCEVPDESLSSADILKAPDCPDLFLRGIQAEKERVLRIDSATGRIEESWSFSEQWLEAVGPKGEYFILGNDSRGDPVDRILKPSKSGNFSVYDPVARKIEISRTNPYLETAEWAFLAEDGTRIGLLNQTRFSWLDARSFSFQGSIALDEAGTGSTSIDQIFRNQLFPILGLKATRALGGRAQGVFLPGQDRLAIQEGHGLVLWDLRTRQQLLTLPVNPLGASEELVVHRKTGALLQRKKAGVVGTADKIRFFFAPELQMNHLVLGPKPDLLEKRTAAFSPDAGLVVHGGREVATVIDVRNCQEFFRAAKPSYTLRQAVLARENRVFLAWDRPGGGVLGMPGTFDPIPGSGPCEEWDLESRKFVRLVGTANWAFLRAGPDGLLLLASAENPLPPTGDIFPPSFASLLSVQNAEGRTLLSWKPPADTGISQAEFLPDGKRLAVMVHGNKRTELLEVDLATGTGKSMTFPTEMESPRLAVLPNGGVVLVGHSENKTMLASRGPAEPSWKIRFAPSARGDLVGNLEVDPAGRFLIVGLGSRILLYDLQTGTSRFEAVATNDPALCFRFRDDGTWFAYSPQANTLTKFSLER